MKKKVLIAVATLALATTTSVEAQDIRRSYIGFNPIGAVFQWYSFEGEHMIGSGGVSLGLSTSYLSAGTDDDEFDVDLKYNSVDAKVRYYPGEEGLKGFSVGGSMGITMLKGALETDDGEERESAQAFSTGVVIDYNWILGRKQRLVVGLGAGAKRLWGLDVDEAAAYPTARLTVGYAF